MSNVLGGVKFPTNSSFGSYYDNLNGCKTSIYPRVRYHNIILEEDGAAKKEDVVKHQPAVASKSSQPALKSPTNNINGTSTATASPIQHQTYFGDYKASPLN